MSIKAMVMSAGAGTRLKPLTLNYPKPMVPIANKPVLEIVLEGLKKHNITNIAMNLHHQPSLIRDYFKDGSRRKMTLQYSYEKKLMGTAGGVSVSKK